MVLSMHYFYISVDYLPYNRQQNSLFFSWQIKLELLLERISVDGQFPIDLLLKNVQSMLELKTFQELLD